MLKKSQNTNICVSINVLEFLDGPFKYQSHAAMQQDLHCVARVSKLVEHLLPIHAQSTFFDLFKNITTAIIVPTIEYGGCSLLFFVKPLVTPMGVCSKYFDEVGAGLIENMF